VYYSIMGSGADSTMELNEFTDLCNEIGIPDKNSKHCKLKDIDGRGFHSSTIQLNLSRF